MSRLTSEKFFMNANKTIAGRCRLSGIQFVMEDAGGAIYAGTGTLANRTFEFKNGSSSGSILFKVSAPIGREQYYGAGCTVYTFMFGDSRILFPDGIFVPLLGGSSSADPAPAKTQMIIYYEAG